MERIYTLIDKLYQQKAQAASPAHLLFTVQLLHQELSQLQNKNGSIGSNKVAVTLPVNINFSGESLRVPFTETKEKEVFVLDAVEDVAEEEMELPASTVAQPKEYNLQKPPVKEVVYDEPRPVVKKEEPRPVYAAQELFNTAFEPIHEVPTLSQYQSRVEVHEMIAERKESLNDRLKEEKTELAHKLKETPIKDLRKAIGINDRFTFLKELFRGDDAMYERSIKTINNFNIFSEAEYWIARELKHKLGWDDTNATVKHFYQLVRRRFA
jgi:cell division protein ZapA (FtsZ GTPase activity inhibitor)